ncbi:hypothetical protein KDK_66350 [Dictyobacter kobayashii]|uniref:Uncharacterized protein n=1 Tax=Dictyobacter kobayashii TaxID=2014872 RepID=A0A402AUT7_9CHLR|nr:hypothetical protein KDK_66350 [Dictyobacter kobayashii]
MPFNRMRGNYYVKYNNTELICLILILIMLDAYRLSIKGEEVGTTSAYLFFDGRPDTKFP